MDKEQDKSIFAALKPHTSNLDQAIDAAIEFYKDKAVKGYPNHHITRRLGAVGFAAMMFGTLSTASKELLDKPLMADILIKSFQGFDKIWLHVVTITLLALIFIAHSKQKKPSTFLLYVLGFFWAASPVLFKLSDIQHLLLFWGALVVTTTYTINRKQGFTRAWSRNRLTCQRLLLLKDAKAAAQQGNQNKDEEKYRESLYKIIEENCAQTHADMIEDYTEFGKTSFGFLPKK